MIDPRINLLATLLAIGSLIAAVVIWEAVTLAPDLLQRAHDVLSAEPLEP